METIIKKIIEIAKKSENELLAELKTTKQGLDSNSADERLKTYGLNKITSFKIDLLEIIKRDSLNFFNIFLFIAGLLSLITKEHLIETFLIFFFLLISILITIFQDYRVNKLSEKLLSYFKNYAFVKRDGNWIRVDAEYLVPGDYLKVNSGYLIPADIRILKSKESLVDESILTGESEPVFKSEKFNENTLSNIGFMGTTLLKGEIEGVVFATGKNTYFGSITKKTLEIKKETAYQKMMTNFAKNICLIAIFISISIILINYLKQSYQNFNDLIIFSIVMSVAIVPEFLPTMTVLALSLAGVKLAKKGLIIKRLSAIEDLGAIEILCTDKTGTITTNCLSLDKIISNNQEKFIRYFLADYYFTKELSPYEQAVLSYLEKENKNINFENFYKNWEFIEDIEFDPVKRTKKFKVKNEKGEVEIIKGAPEELIKISNQKKWLDIFYQEDKKGLRTLGLMANNEFWGIASFIDPLKDSAISAINLAKNLNIEIKILTGDSLNVARAVALKLGLIDENDKVVLGEEIRNLNDNDFENLVKKTKIFARVLPDDKLKIIQFLQKDKFVGFLGEGINDAPALKIANIALAVDNATDVVKQEADIILKEKDLNTIVSGVSEGRKVLTNIGKYIKHTMSDNMGNLGSVAVLSYILPFIPMTPLQILLTNFLTDIPIISFANDNVNLKEIRKPVKMSNFYLILLLIILGIVAAIINITGYLIVKDKPPETIQTCIFFLTTMTGLMVSFLIRTKNFFLFSKPSKIFIFASILGILLTIIFIYLPFFAKIFKFTYLENEILFLYLFLIVAFVIFTELVKIMFYKKFPDVI